MAEPKGFFVYDADQKTLARPGFKYRPSDPDDENPQPGLALRVTPEHVLVRRAAGAGDAFVYLPGDEGGALVREGELFVLPKANAQELLEHPSWRMWEAASDESHRHAKRTRRHESEPEQADELEQHVADEADNSGEVGADTAEE